MTDYLSQVAFALEDMSHKKEQYVQNMYGWFVTIFWLLDDLSQITFVLDDMSQKGAICTMIIWTICHHFFSTWTICYTFIFDDLSQVIFVTILFWTICHKSYLSSRDDMYNKKKQRSGVIRGPVWTICHNCISYWTGCHKF